MLERSIPTLVLFSNEACFHISGYLNSQNDRYWYTESPMLIDRVPLHGVKVHMWCVTHATMISGPILCSATIN
jgi:hypothetical protein